MFSEKLKELRKRDGIPQMRFSNDIGFSQAAVSAWENNTREPGIEALIKIAQYFNVSIDYLVGLKSSEKKEKPFSLSDDEKELLKIFQSLEPMHQKQILGYAQGFYHRAHPNKNFTGGQK